VSGFRSSTAGDVVDLKAVEIATAKLAVDGEVEHRHITFVDGHVRDRATIVQHKTARPVQFEITEQTRASLHDWLKARPTDRGPSYFRAEPAINLM
jgi:prepilin-type processing-associated H-X9-DG protein